MKLNYLRISLTDRCNLNCIYCRPKKWVRLIGKDKLLSFKEIVQFIRIATEVGVRKVRLTGREPFMRKDVVKLVKMIVRIKKIEDITLTTNRVKLEEFAKDLKGAALSRVNVSLDHIRKY